MNGTYVIDTGNSKYQSQNMNTWIKRSLQCSIKIWQLENKHELEKIEF